MQDDERRTSSTRPTSGLLAQPTTNGHDEDGSNSEQQNCCCATSVEVVDLENGSQCGQSSASTTRTSCPNGGPTQKCGPQTNEQLPADELLANKRQQVHISDLLGEYGNYQLFLTVLTFVRYICLAMMTNTGPLIAPSLAFWCQLPHEQHQQLASSITSQALPSEFQNRLLMEQQLAHLTGIASLQVEASNDLNFLKNKCSLVWPSNGTNANWTTAVANNSNIRCTHWTYDRTKSGVTLTDEFNLVCDRDWLRSAFQSAVSIGMAFASVVFGTTSDEHGRRLTMNVCLVVSLLTGLASYWAPSYWMFTITRSLCTMCDLCISGSLYTIIVETLGSKYRGIVCLIVTTGWSIGVMIMPWVTGYFRDFRKVILFTVACHTITMPWILIVAESPRWLLINGRIEEVRRQVQWICRSWNGKSKQEMEEINEKFETLKLKCLTSEVYQKRNRQIGDREQSKGFVKVCRVTARALFGGFFKIGDLFESKELLITTAVFIWITFNSELFYMFFIFNNSDHDDNVKLNYAIGGLMESLATLIAIIMISSLSRRMSLSLTLTIISIAMVSFLLTYDKPDLSVYTLNIAKLFGSSLTSLVFVIMTELFPTSLRQTGAGISSTLGSFGGIIAPFVHNELAQLIGFRNVILVLCVLPLTAVALVPCLRETKGVELADDVDEIES